MLYIAPANSVHSYRWIQYFMKLNFNIVWVSFHKVEEKFILDYPSLKIIVLDKEHRNLLSKNPFKILYYFFVAIFKVRKVIVENRLEFAQVHSYGLYGIFSSFSHSLPTVGTVWGSDIIYIPNLFKKYLIKRALNKCNFVTCDASHMIKRLEQLGIGNFKSKLIYFGVEIDLYNSSNFPHNFGENECFQILSLRNHFEVYDIENIIIAFNKFHQINPNSKLVLAGSGELTHHLKNLVESLSLSSAVEFPGKYNREILKDLISRSSLYISASKSDAGLAASTAECMACGLVCLVSDSGENLEWVYDGINGFVFETGNPVSLLNKLEVVFSSKDRFLEISKSAEETIRTKNNYNIEMNKVNILYKQLSDV